jgi:predicted GTPase
MRVFVLLDARLGINKMDYQFLSFLSSNCVSHQIVLTKCDKLTHEELTKCMKQLYVQLEKDEHIKSCYPYILPTSAVTLDGLDELRANALLASGIVDRKALLPQHKREEYIKKESKFMEQVVKVAKHLQPKLAPLKKAKEEKRAKLESEKQEKAVAQFKKNKSKVVLGLD